MAYGLRLRIEYKDINEVLTRVNIYQDGYSGVADVRYAHAGLQIVWGDQGGEGLPLIYGSSATIYFDAEFDYEYSYLFSADAHKHRVDIEKAGTLIWTGHVEPDSWSEPLIAAPYPVQLTAYDGLGFLKDTPYVPNERKTVGTILSEILAETGLNIAINTDIDWTESAGAGLLSHSIDTVVFEDMSCYEVLEQLFQGCRIFQRLAQWFIISNTKSAIQPVTASGFWQENAADMQVLPAVKQQIVNQDFGYNENLIKNGSFDQYNIELAKFETWTNVGVTPVQRVLNDKNEKFVYIPGKQYWPKMETRGYTNINKFIKKQMAVEQSASILNVTMKYALMGAKYAAAMFVKIQVVGETQTYYMRRKPLIPKDAEFEWLLDDGTIPAANVDDTNAYVCLKSSVAKYKTKTMLVDGEEVPAYYNTYEQVTAYPHNQVIDHFETFKASVPHIPISGMLEIYLYVPYHDKVEIAGSCFTGIEFELVDEAEQKYPSDKKTTIVNNSRNNYTPSDIELVVGDYPDIQNANIIYSGGFRRPDDGVTTGWRLAGGTLLPFAEFIGRMAATAQRVPRQSWLARLADVVPTVHLVIEDANNPGKRFIESGITYDDRWQTVEGEFVELLSVDASLSVYGETTYQLPDKIEFIRPVDPRNIEERVTLIDKNGSKVSFPGYLYENDFEAKKFSPSAELTQDGFTRLQIKNRGVTPYALDFDSGTPQFSLKGAMVECNVDGNPNKIRISAGQLISHHFNARDRDDILTLMES